jgi:hypothetical protein
MKINGTEVKGIKKAIGEWNKDNANKVIIYSQVRHEVIVESKKFYDRVVNKIYGADCLFVDLTAIISDVYPANYKISMITLRTVLRDYVI